MKIFSAAQIKACDAYTIRSKGISSFELMEYASAQCVAWLHVNFPKDTLFVVLCGTGNNGGDGLAIARQLHHAGYGVKAFQVRLSDKFSADCRENFERLKNMDASLIDFVQPDTFITDIPENIVIIDALFGTGLNRPLEGWAADFVAHINRLPNIIISIDIPSGMPADTVPPAEATMISAAHTLSFQFYKRSFLHPETGKYAGDIHILDIGLSETFIEGTHTHYQTIEKEIARSFFKRRNAFSHKGTYGTALLAGGSYGMMGAIGLSIRAAGRAGAGKVCGLIPACGYEIIQTLAPEALCITNGKKFIDTISGWKHTDAVGIGPGLGTDNETILALENFLETYKNPLVLDADALNIMAHKKELLAKLPAKTILTPHPKEFERIFGTCANSMLRVEHARAQAMRYNIIIVLKDRHTAIVTPDGECLYNISGNAGLATAGSGDVLTGIITGLLAQKYEPFQAAALGVYLHGLAADNARERQSMESIIAGDLIDCLGAAFREINSDYENS